METPGYISNWFLLLNLILFILLALGLRMGLTKAGFENPGRKLGIILSLVALWLLVLYLLAKGEILNQWDAMPPRFPIVLIVPLITLIILSFNKSFNRLVGGIPKHYVIYVQSFRIWIEIHLWQLMLADLLPIQMTFEGLNFDILAGVLALPIGYLISKDAVKFRMLGIAYNFIGLALVTTIVTIAILSFPTPLRYFMNEPANRIVTHFPMVWLPGFAVVMAYFLHIVSLKQLLVTK